MSALGIQSFLGAESMRTLRETSQFVKQLNAQPSMSMGQGAMGLSGLSGLSGMQSSQSLGGGMTNHIGSRLGVNPFYGIGVPSALSAMNSMSTASRPQIPQQTSSGTSQSGMMGVMQSLIGVLAMLVMARANQ